MTDQGAEALNAEAQSPGISSIVSGSLARMSLLIAAGWLGTNLGLAIGEPILKFFLKDNLHLTADRVSAFFFVGQFSNYIKVLAGLCTDSIPLFRTRRRYYLILSLLGTGLFFLLLIIIRHTYGSMLIAYTFLYMTVVVTSTTLGGVMVEVGQKNKAEGRLTSQRIAMFRVGSLIGGPVAAWLTSQRIALFEFGSLVAKPAARWMATHPFYLAMGAASFWHLVLVPLFLVFLPEPPTATLNTALWKEALRQFKVLIHSRVLLAAAGMIFLIAASPGFNTPLLYYQKDILRFDNTFILLLGSVGAAAGILGTIVYFAGCRRWNLGALLIGSIVVHASGTLFYLQYHNHVTAVAVTAVSGLTLTLATLPVYDLAFRATPKGSEALGYAVMMSVWNLTSGMSDWTGSVLFSRFHLTFLHLVWLNAGTTALVLVVVPFLPKALLHQRDGISRASAPLPAVVPMTEEA